MKTITREDKLNVIININKYIETRNKNIKSTSTIDTLADAINDISNYANKEWSKLYD
jgi:hypothetical protein